MPCSPEEYPEELWVGDRQQPTEVCSSDELYRAVLKVHVHGEKILVAAFQAGWPECSVNCSSYAKPEHSQFPRPKFEGMGTCALAVKEAEDSFAHSDVPDTYTTKVHADPLECNISHCVIAVHKATEDKPLTRDNLSPGSTLIKRLIRDRWAENSRLLIEPQK